MHEQHELRSSIAEHSQVRRDTTGDQAAQQRPLRGDAHMPFVRDGQLRQPRLPGWLPDERLCSLSQLADQRRGQLLSFPVGQGRVVDRVVALTALQDLQKVQPAFVVRALEVAEQVVAKRGAITVLTAMAGAGVVRADV